MPPNDVKIGAYSPLSAASSRTASWTEEAEEQRWRTSGSEEWRRKRREADEKAEEERRRRKWEEEKAKEPIWMMDEQLARLRETPVTIVSGRGKFAVSIDMNIFRPEDIEVLMSIGRLVVTAEREVELDEHTRVARRFRRTLSIPEDVGTDAVAVHMSGRGILTITALMRRSVAG